MINGQYPISWLIIKDPVLRLSLTIMLFTREEVMQTVQQQVALANMQELLVKVGQVHSFCLFVCKNMATTFLHITSKRWQTNASRSASPPLDPAWEAVTKSVSLCAWIGLYFIHFEATKFYNHVFFRYMDSFNLVSKAYTRRLQQEM